jgi:hypothetical protein
LMYLSQRQGNFFFARQQVAALRFTRIDGRTIMSPFH